MKVAVEWLGSERRFVSRAGKDIVISEVWAKFSDQPYPQKMDVFGKIKIPVGRYSVPVVLSIGRYDDLQARFDFDNAEQLQASK